MNKEEIPFEETQFHATSFCDLGGRVFWWKGDLYRGIQDEHAEFCVKLFEKGIVQRLVEKDLLVETQLTDMTMGGYPLVLKHRLLPFVSYASEWCPEMLKDAARLIIDLIEDLNDDELILSDVCSWDILFDGHHPVFVDFCTIKSADDSNRAWRGLRFRDDFRSYFVYPLRLMAKGYGNLARWLLSDYVHSAIQTEFASLMGYRVSTGARVLAPMHRIACKGLDYLKSMLSESIETPYLYGFDLATQLRQELERVPLPSLSADASNSCNGQSFTTSATWTQKQLTVHKLLSELQPLTVLDIGSGRGWYSLLAASLGSNVVAVDMDDRKVAHCYEQARNGKLPILSLVMDIRYPTPGHGINNEWTAPALQRLACDMVFVLSLVHRLVLDQRLTFEQICDTFSSLANKWLLVEFVSPQDPEVREYQPKRQSWYTLDNFMAVLGKRFRTVNEVASDGTSRVLLLCEK